jgi:peptide/nickel transport system substrate-binding protein
MRTRAGQRLTFELLTVGSGDNAVEQLIQSDMAARGIGMEIRQVEGGVMLSRARAREKTFDALLTGIPGDLSLAYLAAMFEGAQAGGALDYAGFHDPALDALFTRAREGADDALRRASWGAIQDSLQSAMPVAWIYHSRGVQGISARMTGVTMDLRGELATVARWSVSGPPGARGK